MKRNRIYLALLAAAAVLPLSCAKDITEVVEPDNSPAKEYKGISVEFTTAFTKTAIGDVTEGSAQILWEKGDKINVMGYYTEETAGTDGTETTEEKFFCVEAAASEDGASTVFTAVVPENATDIYAVYPTAACDTLKKDNAGNVFVPVKINQTNLTTKFKDAHFCVAKTTLSEKKLIFKNVASVLAFEIKDPNKFASLNRPQLLPLNFQEVRGTVPVSFDAEGSVVLGKPESTANSLDMGDNFDSKSFGAGTHYLAMLPANYTAGFALNLNYFDNPACIYNKAADLSTPKILNIGVVDGKFQDNFYVTVAGAGDRSGKDWDNAMGRDEFVSALAKRTDANSGADNLALKKFLQIWKLKGSTFHLGAGTYVLGDAESNGLEVSFQGGNGTSYCTINILGGYPENGGDKRAITANVTKFSGDNQYHILSVKDRARLHIDGITFCDAKFADECTKTSEKMGAALFITDSFDNTNSAAQRTAHAKGAAQVHLTDCIFENNRNASTGVNFDANAETAEYYGGGSAIAIQKGYLYANRCKFRNNYDKGAIGCVTTCGNFAFSNLKSELFFNACLFEGNVTGTGGNGKGHVLNHLTKGILLGMYNCTFHANDGAAEDGKCYNTNVIDIRRSSIIANTTIYQATYGLDQSNKEWTGYPIRVDGGVNGFNRHIFANNIIQSLPDDKGNGDYRSFALVNSYSGRNGGVYFKGNNVVSILLNKKSASDGLNMTEADETYYNAQKNLAMTWNETLGVFEWDADETKSTNMSLEKMTEVLKSSDIENYVSGGTSLDGNSSFTWGTDFYNWLVKIKAVDKDALGNTRPSEGWLAGSYQQN